MPEIIVHKRPQIITVNCNSCGRKMEAKREEHPPYYCWKCEDKHFGPVS